MFAALIFSPSLLPKEYVSSVLSSITFVMGLICGILINNNSVHRFLRPFGNSKKVNDNTDWNT
jgi:uncharacterized membrane protein